MLGEMDNMCISIRHVNDVSLAEESTLVTVVGLFPATCVKNVFCCTGLILTSS